MQKISIIIPVYNQEAHLLPLYTSLIDILQKFLPSYTYELIFINDGSNDSSWFLITKLATNDHSIKAINFSRTFGLYRALTAGYDHASGDAIITLYADTINPSVVILEMIKAWEQGSKVIYTRKAYQQDSVIKKTFASVYRRYFSDLKNIYDIGDCRLLDKIVLETLKECHEKTRYMHSMISWSGFKKTVIAVNCLHTNDEIYYANPKKFSKNGIEFTTLSLASLKIVGLVGGLSVLATGSLLFGYLTIKTALLGYQCSLFTWVMAIIYNLMGVQFILMWLIGEYISRIHEQQKNRPLYIVEQCINHNENQPESNFDISYTPTTIIKDLQS